MQVFIVLFHIFSLGQFFYLFFFLGLICFFFVYEFDSNIDLFLLALFENFCIICIIFMIFFNKSALAVSRWFIMFNFFFATWCYLFFLLRSLLWIRWYFSMFFFLSAFGTLLKQSWPSWNSPSTRIWRLFQGSALFYIWQCVSDDALEDELGIELEI